MVERARALQVLLAVALIACSGSPSSQVSSDASSFALPDSGKPPGGADAGTPPPGGTDAGATPSGADAGQLPPAPATFVIMSLNMHCLKLDSTTFTTNQARLAAIADGMAAEHVRAAALQEVCKGSSEDALALLLPELKRATGRDWSSQWLETHVAWAGTADQADEGVAVVADSPLSNAQQITYFAQGALQRKAVGATVNALGGLTIFSVHLDNSDATVRASQARETAPVSVTLADPSLDLVVAGDFNDVAGSDAFGAMTTYGLVDLTAAESSDIIDRIFAHRGAALAVASTRTIFDGTTYPVVTDHSEGGVLAVVNSRAAPPVTRTRITASADVGLGNSVFVRGDTAPLGWTWGWRAEVVVPPDQWRVVLTEISDGAPFGYKCLKNDATWQSGSNASGTGGKDNLESPTFP